jgi:hypothetical protein
MKCLNGQSKADSGNDNDQSKTEHAVVVVEENQFFVTGVDVQNQPQVTDETPAPQHAEDLDDEPLIGEKIISH